ncbi:MAG TPA: recombinase family protein, partial [Tepidiformaceae bacterium]
MDTETATRIGIYARISDDKDGQQTATARQTQDARALAERRGWEVVDTFEDIDISAFKLKAKRPEFERMLIALRAGEISGVVVWKLDRLTRQQRDLVRVMEACEVHKAFIASVMEPIDTRESYGQFVAELLVAQARMESANTSARLRRKARELSERGAPPTNGKRCFGYEQGYLTTIDEEAAILREVRDRVFAGESLRAICFDLEQRGIRSPQGNAIRDHILKRTLKSPSIAGQRELDGVRYAGAWPAIITPEESLRLRSILVQRAGVRREAPARTYLLNG